MTLLRSKECCSFCLFCWSPPWPAPTRCPPSGWASRSCTRWWWSSSWCRQVPAWDQRGLHRLHVRDWGELVHKTGESLISGSSLFASKLLSIQIACALYPTATNKNLGGNRVGIDTSSTFKSTSIEFEFGVPFDETTGDGTEVRTTATLSGNSLIKDQVYFKWESLLLFPPLSIASSIICRELWSQAGFRGSRHATSRTTVRLWSLCTPSPARPTLDPSGFTKSSNLRPVFDHDKIELDIWWNIYHTHNKILKIGTNIPHFIISRIRSWSSCQILLGIGSEKKGMPYYGAQIYVNGRLPTRYFPHLTWRGGAQTGFVIGGKMGWARLVTYSIPGHYHLPPTWWPRWPPLVIRWPRLESQHFPLV